MPRLLLALHAMATRFELVLHGADPVQLRAAGEEALAEVTRVEALLSAYRPDSDIGRVNHGAARHPVTVTAETCRVLRQCLELSDACNGAFDITVGPLVRLWRAAGEEGRLPDAARVAAARAGVGARLVLVDDDTQTVAFAHPGVAIDLGAAAKGYAIDLAIEALRAAGVTSALLHGGTSSVHAIGTPPGSDAWRVRWHGPEGEVPLRDAALSVSAPHGRTFVVDDVRYGHVIDPGSGDPVAHATAAGVTGPSSILCDALSTALLVRGNAWLPTLRDRWPGVDGWTR